MQEKLERILTPSPSHHHPRTKKLIYLGIDDDVNYLNQIQFQVLSQSILNQSTLYCKRKSHARVIDLGSSNELEDNS